LPNWHERLHCYRLSVRGAVNSVWACRRAIYVAAETAGRTAVVECVVLAVACLTTYWR
jgi:hypothetical protein